MARISLIAAMLLSAMIGSSATAQVEIAPPHQKNASVSNSKFVAMQRPDQWVFTSFKGTEVVGPDNAKLGSVNDLLFDGTGKIMGVVVAVGGFLGVGTKNVAIDMSAFDVVPVSSGGNDTFASNADDLSKVKLKVGWTKDQLRAAPDFKYYRAPARGTPSTGATPVQPIPQTE